MGKIQARFRCRVSVQPDQTFQNHGRTQTGQSWANCGFEPV